MVISCQALSWFSISWYQDDGGCYYQVWSGHGDRSRGVHFTLRHSRYRPIIVLLSPNPPLSRPDRVRRPGQPRHRVRPGDGGGTARPQGPGDGGRLPAGRVPTRQCGRHHKVPAGAPGWRSRNVIIPADTAWKTQNTWELTVLRSYSWYWLVSRNY